MHVPLLRLPPSRCLDSAMHRRGMDLWCCWSWCACAKFTAVLSVTRTKLTPAAARQVAPQATNCSAQSNTSGLDLHLSHNIEHESTMRHVYLTMHALTTATAH